MRNGTLTTTIFGREVSLKSTNTPGMQDGARGSVGADLEFPLDLKKVRGLARKNPADLVKRFDSMVGELRAKAEESLLLAQAIDEALYDFEIGVLMPELNRLRENIKENIEGLGNSLQCVSRNVSELTVSRQSLIRRLLNWYKARKMEGLARDIRDGRQHPADYFAIHEEEH